jgi:hypothetical protein
LKRRPDFLSKASATVQGFNGLAQNLRSLDLALITPMLGCGGAGKGDRELRRLMSSRQGGAE